MRYLRHVDREHFGQPERDCKCCHRGSTFEHVWQGLLDKLQSDTTRLAAVKAFGRIAESPLPLDMAPVLDRLLTELTSYLRKANRLLRQAALAAIEVGATWFLHIFLRRACVAATGYCSSL